MQNETCPTPVVWLHRTQEYPLCPLSALQRFQSPFSSPSPANHQVGILSTQLLESDGAHYHRRTSLSYDLPKGLEGPFSAQLGLCLPLSTDPTNPTLRHRTPPYHLPSCTSKLCADTVPGWGPPSWDIFLLIHLRVFKAGTYYFACCLLACCCWRVAACSPTDLIHS